MTFAAAGFRWLASMAALFGVAISLHGGATALQPATAGSPLFVDFFIVSADGNPVADLRAEELSLRVGGRARAVRSLQWIPSATRSDAAVVNPALREPFGTNLAPSDGRAIILVLDEDSFRPGRERPIREAVDRFLVELAPRDRVAFATVPYGGLKVDFTVDREAVALAIGRVVGQSPLNQTGSDFACRTRRTLESVTGLLDSLAGGRGPTTVLFVSGGLAPPRRDAAMTLAPGVCELTTDHFEQVGAAASAARAHFYVIQPDDDVAITASRTVETIGGAGFTGSDNPLAGLEHLSGVTGGHRLQLMTARETNLLRIARETSGYYMLEFVPEPSDRNGRRHAVDLRVARSGVTVRARPTLIIARDDGRTPRPPSPRDMLRQPRVFRDLPLRVIGYPSSGDGKQIKILAVVEPAEATVKLQDASAGLFDATGKLTAQWTASRDELAAMPLLAALMASPGTYRLRIAATDAQGRAGTADYTVDAALTPTGSLTISGLVLGLSRAGGFRPAFQFATEPVATAYLEIYGPLAERAVAVTMEIATTENGPPILTIPAAVSGTSESGRHIATAALPIGALPAGDFVVRAIVTVPGQSAGRVIRTLRKIPRN